MRLKDKVVLVTGGARGVGRGIARRLIREGAQLVIADRDIDAGRKTASDLGEVHGRRRLGSHSRQDPTGV